MATYGYIHGRTPEQSIFQQEILEESGITFDGGILKDVPWIECFSSLEPGDELVVVAKSRLGATEDERAARMEMLDLIGVTLVSLTRDFEKGYL